MHTEASQHGFVAYIDESGDEGFSLGSGSSDWFILSAVVARKDTELETVKLLDRFRTAVHIQPSNHVHFSRLRHERRLVLVKLISESRLRTVSIIFHKPSLVGSTLTVSPRLYFYASRLLAERVSWLCRDAPKANPCNRVKLVFSNRAATPYESLREYFRRLKSGLVVNDVKICWECLDIDSICSIPHDQRRGLQIADAVAGSYYRALAADEHGFTEDRYARMLAPVVYARYGNCRSYGLKLMPDIRGMVESEAKFAWIRECYKK